jgi:hypothetical protein
MTEVVETHIAYNYYINLTRVIKDLRVYLLTIPANDILSMPKRVMKIECEDDKMTLTILDPESDKSTVVNIDKNAQGAFIALYIALEQARRKMKAGLLAVCDENNSIVGGNIYDILNLTQDEETANGELTLSLISDGQPDTLSNNYSEIKRYLTDV